MSKNSILTSLLLFTVLFAAACRTEESRWSGTISRKGNVVIVENKQNPLYPGDILSWNQELEIRDQNQDGEPLFVSPGGLEVDDEGNIYVMDQRELDIKVFDENGVFLRHFGRDGQGPGEFQSIHSILLTPENTLMILDRLSLRLTFFSLKGGLLKEISLSEIPRIFRIYPDGAGDYWARFNLRNNEYIYQIKKLDADLMEISSADAVRTPRRRDVFTFFNPNLFFACMPDGGAVWANSNIYQLHVLDRNGKEIRRITKDYDPVKISDKEKEFIKKDFFRGLPPSREVVFPDNYPPFRNVYCDEDGRLFVRTYGNPSLENDTDYDIFDPEGRFLSKMRLPFTPSFWKNGKLYTIEDDESGLAVVKRYSIIWKSE